MSAEAVHPNRDGDTTVRPWKPSDGDLRCQSCGRPNVIWYADNETWNRVMPDDGVLCIPCFIARAEPVLAGQGLVAWGLFSDSAPFRTEFRRGMEAGQAMRAQATDAAAYARGLADGRAEPDPRIAAVQALGSAWVGFDDSHHYGDAVLTALGDPGGALAAVKAQAVREALAEVERRVEAWIRHGEAVAADVTEYDRQIVHEELRALVREVCAQHEARR